MIGHVEKYLNDKIRDEGALHITLFDPEKTSPKLASRLAHEAESSGTAAVMVGGSTIVSTPHLDKIVKAIKKIVKIPVILFPNNVTGISRHADAIWFMSLLNSLDPYFIAGAQVLSAPIVKKCKLEAIPLGYIIVGEGGAVSVIGRACPIPFNKPELAAAYALAAQYMGMRFVYLEGGSGVKHPIPCDMIKIVKNAISVPLIAGGGMRKPSQVKERVKAGANIIVTGTVTEEEGDVKHLIGELVKSVKLK